MLYTNSTLLADYMNDLTLPDVTHGNRPKNRHPEYWNFVSKCKNDRLLSESWKKRNIWFWSDQHFFHKNIIQYSNRPFGSILEMNTVLIDNYISVVQKDDIVVWCGDVAFGHTTIVNNWIKELPGYKIWIVGNHDMDRKGRLIRYVFNETHPCLVMTTDQYQFLITHYPLTNIPDGCLNIHGHIHQHKLDPKNINVSVEQINYTPINFNQLLEQNV